MTTPAESQHKLFVKASDMLGGQRAAARAMDISERTMRRLIAGDSPIHDGFMRDMAKALLDHAQACRELERRLAPELAANLIPDQPVESGRRTGARWKREAE
jgi:hypothetical protein